MEKHVDPMRTESCLLSGGWSPPSVDAIFIWQSHHKRSERNLHNLQGKLLIALWKGKKKENSNLAILKEREERHFQNLLFTSLDTKGNLANKIGGRFIRIYEILTTKKKPTFKSLIRGGGSSINKRKGEGSSSKVQFSLCKLRKLFREKCYIYLPGS